MYNNYDKVVLNFEASNMNTHRFNLWRNVHTHTHLALIVVLVTRESNSLWFFQRKSCSKVLYCGLYFFSSCIDLVLMSAVVRICSDGMATKP